MGISREESQAEAKSGQEEGKLGEGAFEGGSDPPSKMLLRECDDASASNQCGDLEVAHFLSSFPGVGEKLCWTGLQRKC